MGWRTWFGLAEPLKAANISDGQLLAAAQAIDPKLTVHFMSYLESRNALSPTLEAAAAFLKEKNTTELIKIELMKNVTSIAIILEGMHYRLRMMIGLARRAGAEKTVEALKKTHGIIESSAVECREKLRESKRNVSPLVRQFREIVADTLVREREAVVSAFM